MKPVRRRFLDLAGVLVAASAGSQRASAEDYPARPLHIIAGMKPERAKPCPRCFGSSIRPVLSKSRWQGVQQMNESIPAKSEKSSTTASRV